MNKEHKNLWPISIVIIILVVVVLIIYTVNLAFTKNVVADNSYLSDKDTVDANINELYKSKVKFRNDHSLEFLNKSFDVGNNVLKVSITDKSSSPFEGAVSAFVTRPHTSKDDIDLGELQKVETGKYESESFSIDNEGRYKVMIKVDLKEQNTPAVFSYDLNTTGWKAENNKR
ncbi:MAG: FixH family protein [Campylobacterales bacterium]